MAAIGNTLSSVLLGKKLSLQSQAGERNRLDHGRLQKPSSDIRSGRGTWLRRASNCSAALTSENADKQAGNGMKWLGRTAAGVALALTLTTTGVPEALARKEGVNRPELLPKEFTTVIDVAGFLSDGQERRLKSDIARLENDTGFKLRILAQNYPETPGLAIRDYWGVDDSTIVFVADPSLGGNILNFNVGAYVDLNVPRSFWNRLSGKYGNMFYWREQGEDAAIESAVIAIDACLREPQGPTACALVQ
eukprot:TRINITY_DN21670_c0_g1_i1.p1 TRINITY_DN21670_c0_g1~~TRINITY_DN21670_c0_g1_i1.p1  ORF type:complete len:249 (-),score=47.44 TRINITY_DN21670_c0_g1_i1:13-759(-)